VAALAVVVALLRFGKSGESGKSVEEQKDLESEKNECSENVDEYR